MGVNSLPKTVTRQRRGCDLISGPTASESSTLTIRLPSHRGMPPPRKKILLLVGHLVPRLIYCSLGPFESMPKPHVDRFNSFCWAH